MYLVIDVESTGIENHPIRGHPEVIEVGYLSLFEFPKVNEDYLPVEAQYIERFKPSMPISRKAYEIHGILFKDLLKCRKSEEFELPKDTCYLIGHNIKYDHRCLGKPDVKLICTMELAKKLKKQFNLQYENTKLETLIKYFFPEDAAKLLLDNHSALTDCKNTLLILTKLLAYLPGIDTFDKLYSFQTSLKGK